MTQKNKDQINIYLINAQSALTTAQGNLDQAMNLWMIEESTEDE